MKRPILFVSLTIFLFVTTLTYRTFADTEFDCAPNDPQQFCSPSFSLSGSGLSSISGYSANSQSNVDYPRMSVFNAIAITIRPRLYLPFVSR